MYVIVKTSGKQYRIAEGDTLRVEKINGEVGEAITLDSVLLVGGTEGETRIGTPMVEGVSVDATIARHGKAKKIVVFKKKRRQGYHKKQGHRQLFTEITINKINA